MGKRLDNVALYLGLKEPDEHVQPLMPPPPLWKVIPLAIATGIIFGLFQLVFGHSLRASVVAGLFFGVFWAVAIRWLSPASLRWRDYRQGPCEPPRTDQDQPAPEKQP